MIKRAFLATIMFLLTCLSVNAQTPIRAANYCQPQSTSSVCRYIFDTVPTYTASGSRQTVDVQAYGALLHQVSWTSSAEPTSITVVVATSTGGTFSTQTTSTTSSSSTTFSGAFKTISVTITVSGATVDSTYTGVPYASAKLGGTAFTAFGSVYSDANKNLLSTAAGSASTVLVGNGASAAPSFSATPTVTSITGTTVSTTGLTATTVTLSGTSTISGATVTTSLNTTGAAGATNFAGTGFWSGLSTSAANQTASLCRAATNEIIADTQVGGCLVSSLRFKDWLGPIDRNPVDLLLKLNPGRYIKKGGGSSVPAEQDWAEHFGFIAEEVAAIEPRLATFDAEGNPLGVQYQLLTAPLVAAFQREHALVLELSARAAMLEEKLALYEARLRKLEARINISIAGK